jgi:hypothetical protein
MIVSRTAGRQVLINGALMTKLFAVHPAARAEKNWPTTAAQLH